MNSEFELVLGPQDGAKVKAIGGHIPDEIFVGPKWLGDGYAAYGSERCERFPEGYIMQRDGRYWHEYKLEHQSKESP